MERISEWFAAFRDWASGRPWWVQLLAWLLAGAVALVLVLPVMAVLLFRGDGHPILTRLVPGLLILLWGFVLMPALFAGNTDRTAEIASFASVTDDPGTAPSTTAKAPTTTEQVTSTRPTTTTTQATTTTAAPATTTLATTTTTQAPTTTLAPTTTASSAGCHSAYVDCVPIDSDVDCAGGSGNGPSYVRGPIRVKTIGIDPYGLDRDNDGIGCES